jgi:hypothetical protein
MEISAPKSDRLLGKKQSHRANWSFGRPDIRPLVLSMERKRQKLKG